METVTIYLLAAFSTWASNLNFETGHKFLGHAYCGLAMVFAGVLFAGVP